MSKKVDVGLDIGISSVGWAITDVETKEIILHGARLFPTVDEPKSSKLLNEVRREKRSARRQKNRRKILKRDFIKFLIDNNIVKDISFDRKGEFVNEFLNKYINNPEFRKTIDSKENKGLGIFYLRKRAMNEKVSNIELINILYWYINHRGFKYTVAGETDHKKDDIKGIDWTKTPVEIQLDYFEKYNKINGTLNRKFKSKDYLKEIEAILKVNSLSKELDGKYIEFFKRQRSFEEGPGVDPVKRGFKTINEKTISPWSRWKIEDGKLKEYSSIWEITVGKCSVYPTENRAPKRSASSEVFNLLNDLNNIQIKDTGEVLSKKHKIDILIIAFQGKTSTNKINKYLMKELDLSNDADILGRRIDKDGKSLFTPMESIFQINKIINIENVFNELFINEKYNENNIFDKISKILNESTIIENRTKKLKTIELLNDEQIDKLANLSGFSQTHSLSSKAQIQFINIMLVERKNQMVILQEMDKEETKVITNKSKKLPTKWIEDIIDTPTVKRSLRQSLGVLDEIFNYIDKNNYVLRDIVIEMARENNHKKARDNLKNRQKYFEEFNKKFPVGQGFGGNNIRKKLFLLEQQNNKDAYTGEYISKDEVIKNPGNFDIDHIIPRSQSFDNSNNNSVIVRQQTNAKKGNKTPFQFLKPEKFTEMDKLWKEWYLYDKNTPKDRMMFKSPEKYKYISSRIDFSKPENQLGFIQRNLVDTRYTTRALLNFLNEYKKAHNKSFKIKTINGKMTSYARRNLEDRKNNLFLNRPSDIPVETYQFDQKTQTKKRDWHGHHAEDAYLITIINSHYADSKIVEKAISDPQRYGKFIKSNKESQLQQDLKLEFDDFHKSLQKAREELNNKLDKMKFSRMILKKTNVQLFNETLYEGIIDKEKNEIQQISRLDLFEMENKKAKDIFDHEEKPLKVLMDNNLYFELKNIWKNNQDKKLPFKEAAGEGAEHILVTNGKTKRLVRKIRILGAKKSLDEVIFLGNNKNSFYSGMQWTSILVFKNTDNKFKLIPITALNSKFINGKVVIDQEKLNKQKISKKISLDTKPITELYKNSLLLSPEGKEYYVVGHLAKRDALELKPLSYRSEKQKYYTVNTSLKKYRLIYKNKIGKILKNEKLF